MAITKYVATATPSAGGEQVTGFVVYDGTKAYIIPQTATISVAEGTGVTTITPAAPTDIVEVTPDSVSITGNIQPSKTVTELAANSGAITPDGDYDGIASITISSVKLQTPAAFTPVQAASAGTSPITKTDDTAWGLTGVTVNNVLVQTKAATLAEGASSPEVTPDEGYLLSSVTVPGISVYTPEAVTPGASAQTIKQDGSYMKQVTVNAVPLDEAFNGNFTPTTAEQTRAVAANKYFNGTVTVAGAKLQDAGTVNPTTSAQTGTTVTPLTGGAIGYSNFTVGAIQVEEGTGAASDEDAMPYTPTPGKYFSKFTVDQIQLDTDITTVKSNATDNQTIDAAEGKYIKSFIVQKINVQSNKTVAPAESETPVTPDATYDYLAKVTVSAIPIVEGNSFTPTVAGDTLQAEGGYWKQFTVNPVPLQDGGTIAPSTSEQNAPSLTGGNIGFSTFKVGAIPMDTEFNATFTPSTSSQSRTVTSGKFFNGTVTVNATPLQNVGTVEPTESVQSSATVAPLTGGNIGYSAFSIGAIQTETKTVKSNTTGDQTVNATSGKYIKQITVQSLNAQAKTVDNLTTTTGAITPDGGYDVLASVTVNSVKLDTPEVFTPEEATEALEARSSADSAVVGEAIVGQARVGSEGGGESYSVISKTSSDAWGITEAKVEKITVEEKTVKSNLTEDQEVPATAGSYIKNVVVQKLTSQEKTVDPAETSTPVTPDEGVDVLTKVTVNAISVDSVNTILPKKGEDVTKNANGYFKSVVVKGYTVNLQDKTVTPEEAEEEVTADSAYDGLGTVTVAAIPTESKTITATKEEQVVSPTPGKYLKSVTVSGYTLNLHEVEVDELTVGQEIVPEPQYDGISKVTINGVKLQNKTVNGSKSQQQVTKDDGTAWGLGTVTVEGYTPNLQTKTAKSNSTEDQTITADAEYDGLQSVTVSKLNLETKTFDTANPLSTEAGSIVPGEGYDALQSVVVNKVKLQDVSVDPTAEGTTAQKTDATAWGFGNVTVNAPALDEEITINPSEEEQVKTPTGLGFKSVKVSAIQVNSEDNSFTPTLEGDTISAGEGKYFKEFTVAGVPLEEAIELTPDKEEHTFTPASPKLGYKGATVHAVPKATNNSYTPTVDGATLTPDTGFYYDFTVNPAPLAEAQTFTPNKETQTAQLGVGQIGIKGATVNPVPMMENPDITFTPNKEGMSVSVGLDGKYFNSVTVNPVPTEELRVVASAEEQVFPADGEDIFYSKVTVAADDDVELQTKSVTLNRGTQTFTPDTGYGGFSSITVTAPLDEPITVQSGATTEQKTPTGLGYKSVTVTGDPDLIAENIKEGVDILGVTGTYAGSHPEGGEGEVEAGFVAGDWVALDLPVSVTRSESFRAVPYYNNHYLGQTFDGGNYMAIRVFSRCGNPIATVLLNDILGKYYIEKVETEVEIAPTETLNLRENVDSSEIDWTVVSEIKGNGYTITVSSPMAQDIKGDFVANNVVFESAGVTDNPFTGHSKSITLNRCVLKGFSSQAVKSHDIALNDCIVTGADTTGKYIFDCSDSNVTLEGNTIKGTNGVLVKGGSVTIRANTFKTTEASITVGSNAKALNIEGNIYNNPSGEQLVINDSVTDVSTIHLIGDVELNNENYQIEGNSVVPNEEVPEDPELPEDQKKVVDFFNELDQNAITNYMISNKDAVMTAFGVSEGSSIGDLGTLLYDKLQEGGTVTANMNDGGQLNIRGHFYEPSDDFPYWEMEIEYKVPEGGTNKCFPAGSQMSVKGGTVTIHVTKGELTSWGDWNMVLLIYGYSVDISGVTVVNGEESYEIGVAGLTRPNDYDNPCIIDPDSSTWEIHVRQFYLPDADAEGTLTVDGTPVEWSEVKPQIK